MNQKSELEQLQERVKELTAIIESNQEVMSNQAAMIDRVKNSLHREKAEKVKALTRVQKLEGDTRTMTMNELMVRFHEIKPTTPILWITTPNVSVVNAGTFANINDRLKRLCPKLDLVILTAGDFDATQKTDEDLAKLGLFRLPDTEHYRDDLFGGPTEDQKKTLNERLTSMIKVFQLEPQGQGGKEFDW